MAIYNAGQRVRIRTLDVPFSRTPASVMGHRATVIAYRGEFGEPERVSRGDFDAPARALYQVSVALEAGSELLLDIFEHWLEPCDPPAQAPPCAPPAQTPPCDPPAQTPPDERHFHG